MGLCSTWAFCLRKASQGSDVAILVSWWQPPLKTSAIIPLRAENTAAQISQATCPSLCLIHSFLPLVMLVCVFGLFVTIWKDTM